MPTRDAYLAHRAELVLALGPQLAPGDTVLDLACGDGGLADYLRDYTYYRRRREPGDGGRREAPRPQRRARRPQRLRAAGAGRRHHVLPRDLLRARPSRFLPPRRRLHGEEVRLRPQSAAVPRRRTCAPTCARRGSTGWSCDRSSRRSVIALPDTAAARCARSSGAGRSHGSCSRCASATCARLSAAARTLASPRAEVACVARRLGRQLDRPERRRDRDLDAKARARRVEDESRSSPACCECRTA